MDCVDVKSNEIYPDNLFMLKNIGIYLLEISYPTKYRNFLYSFRSVLHENIFIHLLSISQRFEN